MAFTNTKILDLVPSEKLLANRVNMVLAADTALIKAGVTVRSAEVDAVANGGPRKASLPYLLPLDTSEVNTSTDDLSVLGSVGKLSAKEFTVARHDLNYAWGASDLARMITQYDAKGGISAGIGAYWSRIATNYATSSMKGAFAAVTSLSVGATATAFSLALIIDAKVSGGIYADQFDTLIVSPKTKGKIDKMQEVAVVPNAQTNLGYDIWAGFKIIVSNSFGDGQSVLMRSGALAFGLADVAPASIEIERSANGGNGGGGDIVHSRQSFVIHPQGFDYLGAVAPTTTVLETAGSWAKATGVDDTMVGFRLIKHAA